MFSFNNKLFKNVKRFTNLRVNPCARGHAKLLCIVPILVYVLPKQYVSRGLYLLSILLQYVL